MEGLEPRTLLSALPVWTLAPAPLSERAGELAPLLCAARTRTLAQAASPAAIPSFLPSAAAYSAGGAASALAQYDGGKPVLVILGTDQDDTLRVSQAGSTITVALNGQTRTVYGPFAGIAMYGFGGHDVLRVDNTVSVPAVLYGGDGDDCLFAAGPAADSLLGDDGDDLLVSVGGGADALWGGAGLDSFWTDFCDAAVDAEAEEFAVRAVHRIGEFAAPTADSASRPSLEVAGQDLVDPAAGYAYTGNFANLPLWADGPQFNDVRQGAANDCYFLAGLSAMATQSPQTLRQAIAPLGDGTYAVRFFRDGQESYYRIDAQLPTAGTIAAYARRSPDGELWVALLEKAYAQFRTGQNSYASLSIGSMFEAEAALTSTSVWSDQTTGSGSAADLAASIAADLADGACVTAASYDSAKAPYIVRGHGYNVVSAALEGGVWTITVYNPWGYDGGSAFDSNTSDGLLQLSASQFQYAFEAVMTTSVE